MDEATISAATSPEPVAKPRKPLWETILISTPVVLTVLATFLASQSASEMTRAQYHRSLAAQNQSKAGDQWSFFQAKRTRGKDSLSSSKLLKILKGPGKVNIQTLPTAADR